VVTVAPTDTVLTASKKMLEIKVSSAVVAIENKPGGILTWVVFLTRVVPLDQTENHILSLLWQI
jgi:CBS domain-containing protein